MPAPLIFNWDPTKANINVRRQRVRFEEAQTVFDDPYARVFDDEDHSQAEHRYLVVGYSDRHRVLVVAYTERGDLIRIISARVARKKERMGYEEEKQSHVD